jgi:hypothetical protein
MKRVIGGRSVGGETLFWWWRVVEGGGGWWRVVEGGDWGAEWDFRLMLLGGCGRGRR